ncbi:hypothetical protein AXF42_Ash003807 [Apostasia shenzhenica]|uniref:Wall-associated receptor kinase galacturonan-binding domain-containing protein n=1 Tax=Apostasia shenzhenica TaxID=1088818 RepID=A0A2I0AI02_9ASPA|nr:hypothetical protein AXF42_Ash003807 [Apostasia shenzhenica]
MAPAPAASAILLPLFFILCSAAVNPSPEDRRCRSYCGNITVDYPFSVREGCGHPGYRQLLFCINGVLLLHVPSGSYRVMAVDYSFRRLILHDPAMSDCYALAPASPSYPGNGFVAERWRSRFLRPSADNVFFLLGCRRDSPLFNFAFSRTGESPCRNVSGMACQDYYRCPAWDAALAGKPRPWARAADSAYGATSSPPECCSLAAGDIREVNLTHLRCAAYSSAYSLAPLRPPGPGAWSYGIRVAYFLPAADDAACRDCRASGGACGYAGGDGDVDENDDVGVSHHIICLCGEDENGNHAWNSTSTCDSTEGITTTILCFEDYIYSDSAVSMILFRF